MPPLPAGRRATTWWRTARASTTSPRSTASRSSAPTSPYSTAAPRPVTSRAGPNRSFDLLGGFGERAREPARAGGGERPARAERVARLDPGPRREQGAPRIVHQRERLAVELPRHGVLGEVLGALAEVGEEMTALRLRQRAPIVGQRHCPIGADRKSTRLNSSH